MIQFLPCFGDKELIEYPDGFDVEYEIKQAKMFHMVLGLSNPEGKAEEREFGRSLDGYIWDKSSVDITDEYLVPRKKGHNWTRRFGSCQHKVDI